MFFQRWANYGSGDESHPAGSRDGAPRGSGDFASRSRRQFVKIIITSAERFAVTTNAQKHFTTFPEEEEGGGVTPLAHACGRPCLAL